MSFDSFEQSLDNLRDKYNSEKLRVQYLKEENKKLKDEHFKDDELAKMKDELETTRENLYRGFPISEEENKRIKKWCDKHDIEKHGLNTLDKRIAAGGCIGGRYTYKFIPTSIGTIGEVICSCGDSFTFQGL